MSDAKEATSGLKAHQVGDQASTLDDVGRESEVAKTEAKTASALTRPSCSRCDSVNGAILQGLAVGALYSGVMMTMLACAAGVAAMGVAQCGRPWCSGKVDWDRWTPDTQTVTEMVTTTVFTGSRSTQDPTTTTVTVTETQTATPTTTA